MQMQGFLVLCSILVLMGIAALLTRCSRLPVLGASSKRRSLVCCLMLP